MSVPSEIAKIIAKNIARRAATKKIPAKEAREVARQARQNPSGRKTYVGVGPRKGVMIEKKASGAISAKRPMKRNPSKPDTRITKKTALSKDRIQKRSERDRTGPIESGMLSPYGLRKPLGSAAKPEKKYTPEQARAMLKRERKANREVAKREATAQRRSARKGDASGVRSARESVKAHKEDNRFNKATIESREKPRPKPLTPREIAILRKTGKRDYSRGEVNTLAQGTVQREADRIVKRALKDKNMRNKVKAEIEAEERAIAALKKKGK
jgi:hypothetical protein